MDDGEIRSVKWQQLVYQQPRTAQWSWSWNATSASQRVATHQLWRTTAMRTTLAIIAAWIGISFPNVIDFSEKVQDDPQNAELIKRSPRFLANTFGRQNQILTTLQYLKGAAENETYWRTFHTADNEEHGNSGFVQLRR